MTGRPTAFELALLAAARAAQILADDPGAKFVGPAMVFPDFDVPDLVQEQSRRERYLDQLHANLEADRRPKEPVHISLFPASRGARIVFHLDSLKKRKKRIPSERERRRLLGIQLADFLTAGGL
jgi:hypothetical protein